MGKFLLYGLLVVAASSLANWSSLGKSAGSSFGRTGSPGGWIGGSSGWSSSGSGHK